MNKIRILVMDVDGTLTDGKIYMGNNGEMMKAFDIKDGYGIANLLPELQITPVIITGRKSQILENRCKELKIEHLYQGIADKIQVLEQVLKEMKLERANVAYIGDDVNDLECMRIAGITGCPADACEEIKKAVTYVCSRKGGAGAVREFIEHLKISGYTD